MIEATSPGIRLTIVSGGLDFHLGRLPVNFNGTRCIHSCRSIHLSHKSESEVRKATCKLPHNVKVLTYRSETGEKKINKTNTK